MDGWHIAVYAIALYLAIRTLLALMSTYERDFRNKIAREQALTVQKPNPKPAEAPRSR